MDPNIIHDPDNFAGFTCEKLQQYRLCPDDIIFEITERSAMKDLNTFTAAITIAVGIETEAELKTLTDLNIDYGQGYFLSKPAKNFENLPKEQRVFIENVNGAKNSIGILGKIDDLAKKSSVSPKMIIYFRFTKQ